MDSHLLFEKKLPKGTFQVFSEKPFCEVKTIKQIHSDIIKDENDTEMEGDGIIGNSHSSLGILTADCIPLVLIGKNSHAVIHTGWKGLHLNIFKHTELSKLAPDFAFIGPHIRVSNYEIQADFKNNFPHSNSFLEKNNQIYFDLTSEVIHQLKSIFPKIEISDCGICTYSDQKFNSYRRDKTTKRNWNIYHP